MVFGKAAPDTAHQTANRKIESRRAILTFVVSVGRELQDLVRFTAMVKDMCYGTVNLGVTTTALFVVESTRVTDAREH
jgi:hypothetical protein